MIMKYFILFSLFLVTGNVFAQQTLTADEVVKNGEIKGSWVPMSAAQTNYVVMQLWNYKDLYFMIYRDYDKDYKITRMHKVTLEKTDKGKFITSKEFNQQGVNSKYLMNGENLSMYVNGKKMEMMTFKKFYPDSATSVTIEN